MENKNVIIMGDSYSTYKGCIPDGYAAYYGGRDEEPDIDGPEYSWWSMLMRETGWNLVRNDSWSGSTIGYTGYNNTDGSMTNSFIRRLRVLRDDGFFEANKIDAVLVFGGTNDSWCGAPLGEEMTSGWQKADLYSVLPAIHCFFTELREALPGAEIFGICNTDIKSEIVGAIKNACLRVGARAIVLESIDKVGGHPTALGMINIKDQVLKTVNDSTK